jgi:hypothetical protein
MTMTYGHMTPTCLEYVALIMSRRYAMDESKKRADRPVGSTKVINPIYREGLIQNIGIDRRVLEGFITV